MYAFGALISFLCTLSHLVFRRYWLLRAKCTVSQQHKMSWPFRKPVETREAPDYHKIIKEPMGKANPKLLLQCIL